MFWKRSSSKRAEPAVDLEQGDQVDIKDQMLGALIALQKEHQATERSRVFWSRIRYITMVLPLVIIAVVFVFQMGLHQLQNEVKGYVSLVDMRGSITGDGTGAGRLTASALVKAFKDRNTKGVVLRINSGGGQAMQSAMIRDAIDRAREEHPEVRFVVVAEDLMASGAYLVASGADKIYAHPMSMIGSIGAKMESWGFEGALERLGVEHRSFSAGAHKTRLSPFEPLTGDDRAKADELVADIHQVFIDYVLAGRGDRLVAPASAVFSGDVWLGSEAMEMGLIDGYGTIRQVLNDEFGTERVVDYTPTHGWNDGAPGFIAATVAKSVKSVLVELSGGN